MHNSDRGAQYVSITYTERLGEAGIAPSVSSVGDSFDNALAETVIGLFKTEVIRRRGPWRSLEAVEFATLALGLLLKAAASLSDGFAAARNGSTGSTTAACSSPSATSHSRGRSRLLRCAGARAVGHAGLKPTSLRTTRCGSVAFVVTS